MSETEAASSHVRTPYDAMGGEAGVRRLADAFYDAMEHDPAAAGIRAMHGADLTTIRLRLADWLCGWFGGPPVYAARHPGRPCIMSAHAPYTIGEDEAAQWMACMRRALDAVETPPDWRGPLEQAFARMSEGLRTT